MDQRRARAADLLFGVGLASWTVFVVSAGVYAGAQGQVRKAALPVGMLAAMVGVALLVASAWVARSRT